MGRAEPALKVQLVLQEMTDPLVQWEDPEVLVKLENLEFQ